MIKKRKALRKDKEFFRKVHHLAFYDLVIEQFGNFDESEQDNFFEKYWRKGNHKIISYKNKDIGYFSIEKKEDHFYIREVAILPQYQGKGVGTKIMQEIIEDAKQNNLKIKLDVFEKNKARELYRKLGFKETGSSGIKIKMELKL